MPITQKEFEKKYKLYKETYDTGKPLVSDDEFDAFEEMGKYMFPDSNVFNIVGIEKAVKVEHNIPMMSLDKERTIFGLVKWANDETLIATYKLDGCAVSLKFKDGLFISGATRGNGFLGQDVTRALRWAEFPKQIRDKTEIEFRGELVISKDRFELLKSDMLKRGLKEPKSRRNIIPGLISSVRKKDFDLAKYINFVVYDVIGDYLFETEIEKFNYLKELNFEIPLIAYDFKNPLHVINYYKEYKNKKPYLSDGIVFTYNDTDIHERADKNPKHKIAFKFEGEIVSTPILDIRENVSGHGVVSFIGAVEPVELNEATVGRVYLHNVDYIKKHNINIGATIGITRSGDIIPTHVITYIPNGEFVPPIVCPRCNSTLHKDGAFLICENLNCSARKIGKIVKWIEVLDVKGISNRTISELYNNGILKTTSDLYRIKVDDIKDLDGFGESSAHNIINAIKKASQNITHEMIISGANIRNIGKTASRVLIDKYKTVPNMCKTMNYHDLENISGIGDETTTLILKSKDVICSFFWEMNDVIKINKKEKTSDKLKGKSFCITGTLSKSRNEFKEMVENNSGIIKSGVSSKLDYLLAGAGGGNKLNKAIKHKVIVLSEKDFLDLINR